MYTQKDESLLGSLLTRQLIDELRERNTKDIIFKANNLIGVIGIIIWSLGSKDKNKTIVIIIDFCFYHLVAKGIIINYNILLCYNSYY